MNRFGPTWEETATLRDGQTVELRLVKPSDELLLRRAFAEASDASVATRFLTHKPRLTDAEVHYLVDVDQRDHVALGAVVVDPIGREAGVGIARFVRLPSEPTVAEPAVTVLDAYQGLGLGTLLLGLLSEAAIERGIRTFEATFLAANEPVLHMLHDLSPETSITGEGPVITARVALPRPPASIFQRWMRAMYRSVP